MPPKVQRSNAKHYKTEGTITEVKEFGGRHLLPARERCEGVADYALSSAIAHASVGARPGGAAGAADEPPP